MPELQINTPTNEVNYTCRGTRCVIKDAKLTQNIHKIAIQEIKGLKGDTHYRLQDVEHMHNILGALHAHYYDKLSPDLQKLFAPSKESDEDMDQFINTMAKLEARSLSPLTEGEIESLRGMLNHFIDPPFENFDLKILKAMLSDPPLLSIAEGCKYLYWSKQTEIFGVSFDYIMDVSVVYARTAYESLSPELQAFFAPAMQSDEALKDFANLFYLATSQTNQAAMRAAKDQNWDYFNRRENNISLFQALFKGLITPNQLSYLLIAKPIESDSYIELTNTTQAVDDLLRDISTRLESTPLKGLFVLSTKEEKLEFQALLEKLEELDHADQSIIDNLSYEWELHVLKAVMGGAISPRNAAKIFAGQATPDQTPVYYSMIEPHLFVAEHKALYEALSPELQDYFSPTLETPQARLKFIELCKRLETTEVSDAQIKELTALDPTSPIFQETDWDLYVLKGLMSHKLSIEQANLLLLFQSCGSYENPQVIHLFNDDGGFDDEAFELLVNHIRFNTLGDELHDLLLDETQQQVLKGLLQELDPTNACFFLIPAVGWHDDIDSDPKLTTVLTTTSFLGGSHPQVAEENHSVSVFSPTLMRCIMSAYAGKDAVDPRPVTGGLSSFKRFFDANQRDVFIPCRWLDAPGDVHSMPTDALGIYLHDVFFHLVIASSYPKEIRQLFVNILLDTDPDQAIVESILDFASSKYIDKRQAQLPLDHNDAFITSLSATYQGKIDNQDPILEKPDPQLFARSLFNRLPEIIAATDGQVTIDTIIRNINTNFDWGKDVAEELKRLQSQGEG